MTKQDRIEFAAKLRAHVSILAATKMEMSLIEWNEIASDFLEAAQIVQDDSVND